MWPVNELNANITLVLCSQEEVMEFVNSIAKIVHTAVALHGGAANKNIGDAFLTVWKFPKGFAMRDIREALDSVPQCTAGTAACTAYPGSTGHMGGGTAVAVEDVQGQAEEGVFETRAVTPVGATAGVMAAAVAAASPAELLRLSGTQVSGGGALALRVSDQRGWVGDDSAAGHGAHLATGASPAWPGLVGFDTPEPVGSILEEPVDGAMTSEEERVDRRRSLDGMCLMLTPSGPLGEANEASRHAMLQARTSPAQSAPAGVVPQTPPSPTAARSAVISSWHQGDASTATRSPKNPTPTKQRFLSVNPNNRVAPLPSSAGAAGLPWGGQRALGRMGSSIRPLGLPSTEVAAGAGGPPGPLDMEEEALRKVIKMRSVGGARNSFTTEEKREVVHAVADNALAAFVVIHAALKRSVRLARYAGRQDLIARLGEGWRVQMGFGLHVGWAIEGAIGEWGWSRVAYCTCGFVGVHG